MHNGWKNVSYSRSFGVFAELSWIYDIYVRANSLYGSDASILSVVYPTTDSLCPLPPLNKCPKSNCSLRLGLRLKVRLVLMQTIRLIQYTYVDADVMQLVVQVLAQTLTLVRASRRC